MSIHFAFVISVSSISTFIIIMLCVLIRLLQRLYCSDVRGEKILPLIKFLSIVCHSIAIVVASLDLMHITLSYTEGIQILDGYWIYKYPLMSLADALYFTESLCLYTLMLRIHHRNSERKFVINSICRLYYTFIHTSYALSEKYLYCLLVLIEQNIKTMVVYFYYICIDEFQLNNLGVVTYLRVIFEVVLNVAVLVLFVKKLWEQILVMLVQTNDDRIDRKSFAEAHTIRFINVVTRYFLLSFISIIFTPSFYVAIGIVINLYFGSGQSFDPTMYIYIIYLVRAFELTLITSVLFLNFGFNRLSILYMIIYHH